MIDRWLKVKLPVQGHPLSSQEDYPTKANYNRHGNRKADSDWHPVSWDGQSESLYPGSWKRVHHQPWHLVHLGNLCNIQRRKIVKSVIVPEYPMSNYILTRYTYRKHLLFDIEQGHLYVPKRYFDLRTTYQQPHRVRSKSWQSFFLLPFIPLQKLISNS